MNINKLLFLIATFCLGYYSVKAQIQLAEIEGRLSVYLPADTLSIHIGKNAGINSLGGGNTFVGTDAGRKNVASFNSFFGTKAGASNTGPTFSISDGSENSFFGYHAGFKNEHGNGNSFFGAQAGYNSETGGNSFFGSASGKDNIKGTANCFFGFRSGQKNHGYAIHPTTSDSITKGSNNSFYGYFSGYKNTTGEDNVFIGSLAGYNNIGGEIEYNGEDYNFNGDGSSNVFLGSHSGENNQTGSKNILIGNGAGNTITEGDENIMIGHFSGNKVKGSGNVFIGRGPYITPYVTNDSTFNEKLFIGNYENVHPLIYGEFDNNLLRVEGEFQVTDRIGVGTNNPESKIHIAGSSTEARLLFDNAGDIMWKTSSGTQRPILTLHSDDNTYLDGEKDIVFRTKSNFQKRMRIDEDGNVGIGVDNPNATLHIKDFAKLEPQTTEPDCDASDKVGRIYFNQNDKKLKVCINTSGSNFNWVNLH